MKAYVVTKYWSDERTLRDYSLIVGVYSDLKKARAKQKEVFDLMDLLFCDDPDISDFDVTVVGYDME